LGHGIIFFDPGVIVKLDMGLNISQKIFLNLIIETNIIDYIPKLR
jgi:hypothetical protein